MTTAQNRTGRRPTPPNMGRVSAEVVRKSLWEDALPEWWPTTDRAFPPNWPLPTNHRAERKPLPEKAHPELHLFHTPPLLEHVVKTWALQPDDVTFGPSNWCAFHPACVSGIIIGRLKNAAAIVDGLLGLVGIRTRSPQLSASELGSRFIRAGADGRPYCLWHFARAARLVSRAWYMRDAPKLKDQLRQALGANAIKRQTHRKVLNHILKAQKLFLEVGRPFVEDRLAFHDAVQAIFVAAETAFTRPAVADASLTEYQREYLLRGRGRDEQRDTNETIYGLAVIAQVHRGTACYREIAELLNSMEIPDDESVRRSRQFSRWSPMPAWNEDTVEARVRRIRRARKDSNRRCWGARLADRHGLWT